MDTAPIPPLPPLDEFLTPQALRDANLAAVVASVVRTRFYLCPGEHDSGLDWGDRQDRLRGDGREESDATP